MPLFPASRPDPALVRTLQKIVAGKMSRGGERRRAHRYSYPAMHQLAPYDQGGLPTAVQFREVRCQDLSTSGISFHWPTPPDFDDVVIQLGKPSRHLRHRPHHLGPRDADHPGELLVGCQFTGRVQIGKNDEKADA